MSTTPVILYRTSNFSSLVPKGQWSLKFPLPPQSSIQLAAYAFDQEFQTLVNTFGTGGPFPKNKPSTSFGFSDANAILSIYSPLKDMGAGMVSFMAGFNRVPGSWNDFKALPFTFPGFPGIIGQTGSRNAFTDIVDVRIQYDYYVLDNNNIISSCSAGTPANSATVNDSAGNPVKCVFQLGDIPTVKKSIFCVAFAGTPDFTNRTNSLIIVGGATIGNSQWYETFPSKNIYQSWIANSSSSGWLSTPWDGVTNMVGAGQLITDDSRLEPFSGNIIARLTQYVLVK